MNIVGDHKNRGYLKNGYSGSSSASKQVENIVLVGRTGNGKSATGNSLIGKRVFKSKPYASGVTMHCQTHGAVRGAGHTINVIDTPGLFDLSVSAEYISKEIVRCLTLAEGGIHAVLLVLSARTRMTQEEANTLSTLQALFGSQILSYVIVVFTGGDVLEEYSETLDDYLGRDCPAFIMEVIKMTGNRMVLFDNKTHDEDKKEEQVHNLLTLVDEIRRSNHGEAYTDDMYREIKEETNRLHTKHRELESNDHSKEMVSLMKDQLDESYQENMNRVSNMVEKKLKTALEAQEKALSKIINYGPSGTVGNRPILTVSVPLPPIPRFSCNIL